MLCCVGPCVCAAAVWSHQRTVLSVLHCSGQHKPAYWVYVGVFCPLGAPVSECVTKIMRIKCVLNALDTPKERKELPLDALKRAARHVHNSSRGASDHSHQAFTDAFEETCGTLLFGACTKELYSNYL